MIERPWTKAKAAAWWESLTDDERAIERRLMGEFELQRRRDRLCEARIAYMEEDAA